MNEADPQRCVFDGSASSLSAVEGLFHHRTVDFAFHRTKTEFDLARTVFASASIDPGSALLLRHLQSLPLGDVKRVLDVGCGHGTLGIVLKALDDQRQVTFIDRDALACRYTARNLVGNGMVGEDVEVHGSLAYDALTDQERYDLVVSNIPGKVGDAAIEHLVRGAAAFAGPRSMVGFVVVNPLADQVRELLPEASFELLLNKGNKTHEVVVARVIDAAVPEEYDSSFDGGVYDRTEDVFSSRELTWQARTVVGLDEFDSLAQPTKLLRQALQGVRSCRSTIVNPGQGHRAVVAALAGYPPSTLLARDMLALRATDRALTSSGFADDRQLVHDIGLTPTLLDAAPLTVLHADDKVHGPWLTNEILSYLDHAVAAEPIGGGGERHLVLSGRSGILGRLEADVFNRRPGHLAYKKSVKGHRVVRFVPKQKR